MTWLPLWIYLCLYLWVRGKCVVCACGAMCTVVAVCDLPRLWWAPPHWCQYLLPAPTIHRTFSHCNAPAPMPLPSYHSNASPMPAISASWSCTDRISQENIPKRCRSIWKSVCMTKSSIVYSMGCFPLYWAWWWERRQVGRVDPVWHLVVLYPPALTRYNSPRSDIWRWW